MRGSRFSIEYPFKPVAFNFMYDVSFSQMTPDIFRSRPAVIDALKAPRSPRSVLNYMCASDTADPQVREALNTEDKVTPLLGIWFASGSALDDLCQPFAPVIRELKADPPTLIGAEWENV